MATYKIELNTQNWYCECCGSGAHWDVTLYEGDKKLQGYSRNDQFGGTYRDGDDEDVQLYDYRDLIVGMQKTLEALGHEVWVEENIDEEDPWYCDEEDYEENGEEE